MYNEKRVKKSELLQLILLDSLYAQSGSERIIFQGGTALRWVYGGMRFSEDLDFVTQLGGKDIQKILNGAFHRTQRACTAQFGPGEWEHKEKSHRNQSTKIFFIYRPEAQRERIAVRLEFETLKTGYKPAFQRYVLRDLSLVAGMLTGGELFLPYSSSIILAETPDEILSDKIRALYERKYLKGRDIYDVWWIRNQLKLTVQWPAVREKLLMYQAPFTVAREADYFQKRGSASSIRAALEADLPRFLPRKIVSKYQVDGFAEFVATLKEATSDLSDQGLGKYFEGLTRRKDNA